VMAQFGYSSDEKRGRALADGNVPIRLVSCAKIFACFLAGFPTFDPYRLKPVAWEGFGLLEYSLHSLTEHPNPVKIECVNSWQKGDERCVGSQLFAGLSC